MSGMVSGWIIPYNCRQPACMAHTNTTLSIIITKIVVVVDTDVLIYFYIIYVHVATQYIWPILHHFPLESYTSTINHPLLSYIVPYDSRPHLNYVPLINMYYPLSTCTTPHQYSLYFVIIIATLVIRCPWSVSFIHPHVLQLCSSMN